MVQRVMPAEDVFDFFFAVACRIDKHQHAPAADLLIVRFRVFFGNAEADQAADEPAAGRADGDAGQRRRDRARREQRPDAGNRQRAESGQKSAYAAQDTSGRRASGGAFGCFGAGLFADRGRILMVFGNDGNIVGVIAVPLQLLDRFGSFALRQKDARYFLSLHLVILLGGT